MSFKEKIKSGIEQFVRWRAKHISDRSFILAASVVVGIIAGLSAVALKVTVRFIQDFLMTSIKDNGVFLGTLIFPVIGILLTVIYVQLFHKKNFSKGLSNIIYAIAHRQSEIPNHNTYSQAVTSAVTVGFGGSVGLEAPIAVTGAAIGSGIARWFGFTLKVRTLLIACGSAAGISAIFNSPIAGVIFAFEVILTDYSIPSFIPLLIASAISAILSNALYSGQLFFLVTEGWAFNALPFYILLGVLCGMISAYMILASYKIESYLQTKENPYYKAVIGGIGLSFVIFLFPPLYGEGYRSIEFLLNGSAASLLEGSVLQQFASFDWFILVFLALIILIKIIATALTIGAGGNGGVIAPSLFTGAVTGAFLTHTVNYFGIAVLNTQNFIVVGMAGILSGVLRAPLTGIFLIAEITGGYKLFVPLMIVSAVSYFIAHYFERNSVYTKILAEKGGWAPSDRDRTVLSNIPLADLIEKDFSILRPTNTMRALVDRITHSKRNIFPVIGDDNVLLGIVTLDDVREVMLNSEMYDVVLVSEIMTKPVATVSTTSEMLDVMKLFEFHNVWNLPVVDNGKYHGFISKSNIINKYRTMVIKQGTDPF